VGRCREDRDMKKRIDAIREMKGKEKICCLTAYDFQTAQILDKAGIDIILVGDSLGMVVLGYENTLPVTLEEILHHTRAVKRGVKSALIVADMPFLSYKVKIEDSVYNAGRLIKEGGAEAVKIEGTKVLPTIKAMIDADIPVMGHIGLTPQAVHKIGGYKVQRDEGLIYDAKALQDAGCFSIVLECVPMSLAKRITEAVEIPTIGCGAGPFCDGQILVVNDLLGLTEKPPRFSRRYLNLKEQITESIKQYTTDVRERKFPREEESYG
jgi:3-methyl-2-oxobutanoate hydroxymethyltransferase